MTYERSVRTAKQLEKSRNARIEPIFCDSQHLFRPLAARNPDAYNPELAMSLRLLAEVDDVLGQPVEAAKARAESE